MVDNELKDHSCSRLIVFFCLSRSHFPRLKNEKLMQVRAKEREIACIPRNRQQSEDSELQRDVARREHETYLQSLQAMHEIGTEKVEDDVRNLSLSYPHYFLLAELYSATALST